MKGDRDRKRPEKTVRGKKRPGIHVKHAERMRGKKTTREGRWKIER